MKLKGKTLFITGAGRGIGLSVAIAAKTGEAHPKLAGTVHSAAEAVEQAGRCALPLVVGARDDAQVKNAVKRAAGTFGGIDICIHNASAINLMRALEIAPKRCDLIQKIGTRGTFFTPRACIPHLRRRANARALALSAPRTMRADRFAAHLPHRPATPSKCSLSMVMFGLAEELKTDTTPAVKFELGGEALMRRAPDIRADAACAIAARSARECSGRFLVDDDLAADGVTGFDRYRSDPWNPLQRNLLVDHRAHLPRGSSFATHA